MKKKLFYILVFLFTTFVTFACLSLTKYAGPIHISNCTELGGDSPEGLYFDGIYVYDGPNDEVGLTKPYKIKKVQEWAILYNYYTTNHGEDWCNFISNM